MNKGKLISIVVFIFLKACWYQHSPYVDCVHYEGQASSVLGERLPQGEHTTHTRVKEKHSMIWIVTTPSPHHTAKKQVSC